MAVALLTACSQAASTPTVAPATGGTGATTASPVEQDVVEPGTSLVATATADRIEVHRSPGGPVSRKITRNTGPITFLVMDRQDGWLKVHLPTRPNGATGWIARDEVGLSRTPYRLIVSMDDHELVLLRNDRKIDEFPVGVGKSTTPTPPGEYYLTELIRPPDPHGVYGPYAFGLSAHSETLQQFAGGPGQLGLHGTNEPDRLGHDVSHGCLRLANDVITELAKTLPLGTPVVIQA
ncbi:L,D-transpeptidase family protein [Kineosporia succinea]|uniref:Lipoprotein-anchoring transpeptidase ErfK/SrfK n=1 Tax=Kineosporia succinea TaxID=84632 RepID=A0ABT9NXE5_9ACTN|nr:L,D-transpeptidase [Kineosporia succinea]MDP9825101.1 lipoprotein-anchoring transpeptidase ErfK/SrfK [Kineosporia succinea]